MTFHVGQKVCCISNQWAWALRPSVQGHGDPQKGDIVTVAAPGRELFGVIFISLSEYSECWYEQSAFRPLVEKKTDISLFQKMLIPSKVDA